MTPRAIASTFACAACMTYSIYASSLTGFAIAGPSAYTTFLWRAWTSTVIIVIVVFIVIIVIFIIVTVLLCWKNILEEIVTRRECKTRPKTKHQYHNDATKIVPFHCCSLLNLSLFFSISKYDLYLLFLTVYVWNNLKVTHIIIFFSIM